MEKLETEKIRMEQQNQFLLQRLSQMEAENNRLSQQVAQLSAEVRGSRSSTPVKAGSPVPHSSSSAITTTASPTLTPTLFKQEGEDLQIERIPFPTPSTITLDYSPTLKPSTLAEATPDVTQHPAVMLCPSDLQCPSAASKEQESATVVPSLSSTSSFQLTLATTLQLLFLTMTSVASSTVTSPLLRILHSLKTGSPLALSTAEIYQHFPLIHWLISTPSLSPSTATGPSFRMRLLTRLLACSPALARPLRDATGRALQLAVREQIISPQGTVSATSEGRPSWMSLLTMVWAIDSITSQSRRRGRTLGGAVSSLSSLSTVKGAGIGKNQSRVSLSGRRRSYGKMGQTHQHERSTRSSWSSSPGPGETMSSVLLGKQL